MSLISELGRSYFNEMCTQALFVHEDTVHRVERADALNVVCTRYLGDDGTDEEIAVLPHDVFTGWKVFAYPRLGYRRIGENIICHLQRQQSTRRGLRPESINAQLSPCTHMLHNLGLVQTPPSRQRIMAAMKPVFDEFSRDVPRMIEGELAGIVLSDTLMIEPDVSNKNPEGYKIYLRQHVVGKMDDRGLITWEDEHFSKLADKYRMIPNG